MTKALIPTEMSKGQRDNTKTLKKSSITPWLRTDLGRSVGVPTVDIQLVRFTGFTGPTLQQQYTWNASMSVFAHKIVYNNILFLNSISLS